MSAQAGRVKSVFVIIIIRMSKISASVGKHYCARSGRRILAPWGLSASKLKDASERHSSAGINNSAHQSETVGSL